MRHALLTLLVFLGLLLLPLLAWWSGEAYLVESTSRLVVFAIAASSLNFITGYGGMVSLGHAMFMALGAYTVGILAYHGVTNGFVQLGAMLAVTAIAAAFVAGIALRATGIFFIMITLALAQIFYYLAVSSSTYGGEEGLPLMSRSSFFERLDLYDPYHLYLVCVGTLALCLLAQWRILRSPFGQVLVAVRENERRARAIGYNTFVYKLVAIVISGMMCGLAGFLLANLSDFVGPDYGYWHRSGELLVMVLLGGMGTLVGPVLGALTFLSLEHWVASKTQYWGLVIGPLLMIVVLVSRGGIVGLVDGLVDWTRRRRR